MTTIVQVREIESGSILERMSVDAAEMLATGRYEQVSGPTIRVAPPEKPKAESGPPVAKAKEEVKAKAEPPQLNRPHLKHAGFGKWNVFRADGAKVNEESMKKAEAEALLATL